MESERCCITEATREELEPKSGGLRPRQVIRDVLGAISLFIAVFLALHFSIQNFRIDGASMSPTLEDEQHVLISRLSNASPGYGDVIAFSYPLDPTRDFMKRVIGVPGDSIEVNRGQVIRNGMPLAEPYVVNEDKLTISPVKVPEGSYFVLGDNRPASSDSRSWGFVHEEHIIGRAWLSYWPWDRFEFHHSLW